MSNWFTAILLRIIEPLLSLLEQLGLKQPLKKLLSQAWTWVLTAMVLVATSLWGAWLWLWKITPLWAVPFLLICVVTVIVTAVMWLIWLFLRLIEQWHATHSRLSLDPAQYREIGTELLKLSDDISVAKSLWDEAYPTSLHPKRDPNWFERTRSNEAKIQRQFRERFLARVVHALYNVSLLGIYIPHHMGYSVSHGSAPIDALCGYLALVGRLLSNNQIDDARRFTDDSLRQGLGWS